MSYLHTYMHYYKTITMNTTFDNLLFLCLFVNLRGSYTLYSVLMERFVKFGANFFLLL